EAAGDRNSPPSCKRRCNLSGEKESQLRSRRFTCRISSPARGDDSHHHMDATRRGNYESGSDYVLEYGELRFTFNERDFTERVEQAAVKLGFVPGPLEGAEREDLVNLAVNGEVTEPASALGEHIVACWQDLAGNTERSLVHWLRRLVFRGAWLD